jgi:hypothetical protein
MPRAEEIGANVLATPQQVARGFFLLGGNVNGGERPGPVEDRQVAGVTTIRFDPIPRAAGDQGRRNHIAGDSLGRGGALQLKAARSRFVAARHRALALQARDEAQNRRRVRR